MMVTMNMRIKKLIMAVICLAISMTVLAADNISIKDFRITRGEWKIVSVELNNEATYVAFQFDVYLPDGYIFGGCWPCIDRVPESTTSSFNQQDDGSYRVIAAAMEGQPIKGNSGEFMYIYITPKEDAGLGSKTGYLRNVKVSKADGTGFTVSEIPFTITLIDPSTVYIKNCTREYGDENPVFEYTVEGGELDGTPYMWCDAWAGSPVGEYTITGDPGTCTNFNMTFVGGTLTITKAPLTIKARDYTIKQGEPLPEFEVEYEGFKNGEYVYALNTLPTLSTTATSDSEPGKYQITVSGATAENYAISYVAGTLTIEGPDFIPGDANGDGKVNVTDIVEIVSYIMGKPSNRFVFTAADVTGDGDVNVTDIVSVVNIILSNPSREIDEISL